MVRARRTADARRTACRRRPASRAWSPCRSVCSCTWNAGRAASDLCRHKSNNRHNCAHKHVHVKLLENAQYMFVRIYTLPETMNKATNYDKSRTSSKQYFCVQLEASIDIHVYQYINIIVCITRMQATTRNKLLQSWLSSTHFKAKGRSEAASGFKCRWTLSSVRMRSSSVGASLLMLLSNDWRREMLWFLNSNREQLKIKM